MPGGIRSQIMSSYHLLTQAKDLKTVQAVCHIPTPNTNNAAGKSYRTALKEMLESRSEDGTIISYCPSISPAELTQIQAGEIYEIPINYRFSVLGLTNTQKRNELDAEFNKQKIVALNTLETELEWWGFDRDVPA